MKKLILLLIIVASSKCLAQYDSGYTVPPVTSSYDFALIQKTLATRQNAYNVNAGKVDEALRNIYNWLENSGVTQQKQDNIRYAFRRFFVQPVFDKGYDYSDTILTGKIIDYLFDSFKQVYKDEMTK